MAQRPVFRITTEQPYYNEKLVSFQYFSGFSDVQKKKSIGSLHDAFLKEFPTEKVLEISTKSDEPIGISLSAFNLMVRTMDNKQYSVESAFQSSKVFENGGPYKDILNKESREAKRDPRLKQSGKMVSFYFSRRMFPIEPKNFFYNWLYVNVVNQHRDLAAELQRYTAFTDIEFNPEKSINCQACAAAIYVSLCKSGKLHDALKSPESFLNIVYGNNSNSNEDQAPFQMTLW